MPDNFLHISVHFLFNSVNLQPQFEACLHLEENDLNFFSIPYNCIVSGRWVFSIKLKIPVINDDVVISL